MPLPLRRFVFELDQREGEGERVSASRAPIVVVAVAPLCPLHRVQA